MLGNGLSKVAIALLAAGLCAAGCTSTPTAADKSAAAANALQNLRDGLSRASGQVQVVATSLQDLSAMRGDMQETYDTFCYSVTTIEKQAAKARERVVELRAKKEEYLKSWEKELAEAKDPEIKERMTLTREQTQADFARIVSATTAVGESYQPWIKSLNDVRGTMAPKPTPAEIVAMKPKFAKALADSANLQTRLAIALAEIDRMARLRAARLEH